MRPSGAAAGGLIHFTVIKLEAILQFERNSISVSQIFASSQTPTRAGFAA